MEDISISPEAVKKEFTRSTERFHVITCWVGLLLNLVWFVSDIFVLPDHWKQFFEFRIAVSGIAIIFLLTKKWTKLDIYACMFVLVLGISIQNSYMWSVMDLAHLQQHAFAYMVLFIGVGMLVLWDIWYSIIILVATVISNIVFYKAYSELTVDQFVISGGLLVLTVAIFCVFLIRTRYRLTMNEIKSRLELAKSKEIIEMENVVISKQKEELFDKNKEITDSINYAKRIQSSLIPKENEFTKSFKDSFVLFKPKDIVSGDFYWIYEKNNKVYYATADCTGHGVPGGFMTMLGLSFLEEIVSLDVAQNPADILNIIRDKIVSTLRQTGSAEENKDGMDVVLCCVDKEKLKLTYAAANNSFYILRKDEKMEYTLIENKGDKQPCGFFPDPQPFTLREVELKKDDIIYTLTDGYPDQFGGKTKEIRKAGGKKFRYKALEMLLIQNCELPFAKQKDLLNQAVEEWRGELDQVDDILIIGVKI
ncbi:MAG: SpoIIE family protein phosphatase [Sphingobacteriaceae bacterium]|nr:SpoIIE family protein phosphatase [Sphingobacteriaceae bacterium]